MYRKLFLVSVVLSVILLAAGVAAFSWVRIGQKKESQRLQEQRDEYNKYNAGLSELERVVSGEIDVRSFIDTVPEEEDEPHRFDQRKATAETRESVTVIAILCMFVGGAISVPWLLLCTLRLLSRGLSCLRRFLPGIFGSQPITADAPATPDSSEKVEKGGAAKQESRKESKRPKKRSGVLVNSGWHDPASSFINGSESGALEDYVSLRTELHLDNSARSADKLSALLSDRESAGLDEIPGLTSTGSNAGESGPRLLCKTAQKAAPGHSQENNSELEELLKTQSHNLEKQVEEFKQMAQSVQQTTLEHSEPLKSNLAELIQEVSAIREYALQQQGRMEKLQDGYDWNIIRTFCLRIIRCIDNLENRIARLSGNNGESIGLEEVRDELLFALESSGVERFEPEVNSNYRGQERKAEAVRDKQKCDDPKLKGKVAEIIRPGYQHVIDEENIKVVRTAQVRLFG
ncbi:MAG: nucleotide exchange factor GrpE [Planctomycetota bacterium]|jgi:molecular chaperone GrpE (heat shock protein)